MSVFLNGIPRKTIKSLYSRLPKCPYNAQCDKNNICNGCAKHIKSLYNYITKRETKAADRSIIKYRDMISTGGRPLSAAPEIKKMPVPCPRCKVEKYADWTLLPHQLYNSYMPGGIGHYCFPCFCAIVSKVNEVVYKAQLEDAERLAEVTGSALKSDKVITLADFGLAVNAFQKDCLDRLKEKLDKGVL